MPLKANVGFSIIDYVLFLLKFTLLFQKNYGLFGFDSLAARSLIFKVQSKVLKFHDICVSCRARYRLPWRQIFKSWKIREVFRDIFDISLLITQFISLFDLIKGRVACS